MPTNSVFSLTHFPDLKYDNCGVPEDWEDEYTHCVPDTTNGGNFPNGTCPDLENPAPEGYDWSTSKEAERFNRMRDALQQQNRTILYSLCSWGDADVSSWGNETGASWRMSGDIFRMLKSPTINPPEQEFLLILTVRSGMAPNFTNSQPEHVPLELRRFLGPQ